MLNSTLLSFSEVTVAVQTLRGDVVMPLLNCSLYELGGTLTVRNHDTSIALHLSRIVFLSISGSEEVEMVTAGGLGSQALLKLNFTNVGKSIVSFEIIKKIYNKKKLYDFSTVKKKR